MFNFKYIKDDTIKDIITMPSTGYTKKGLQTFLKDSSIFSLLQVLNAIKNSPKKKKKI